MIKTTKTRIKGVGIHRSLVEYLSATDELGGNYSTKTMEEYCRKTIALECEIQQDGFTVTPANMVNLLSQKIDAGNYAQSTIRSMKAALIFWLLSKAQARLDAGRDLNELQFALNQVQALRTSPAHNSNKTASRKLEMFPSSVVDMLIEHANNSSTTTNLGPLVAFIKANLLVGLRPSEWFGSSLFSYLERDSAGKYIVNADSTIKSIPSLRVQHGKASYDTDNEYFRELLLKSVSNEDLASIIHFKTIIDEFARNNPQLNSKAKLADAFFIPLQKQLDKTLKELDVPMSRMPTSYSTRHQAMANAKFSGMSPLEIAAFFGLSSLETAKTHYGKKANGSRKMTFTASRESVAAVPQTKQVLGMHPTVIAALVAAEWNANTQRNTP